MPSSPPSVRPVLAALLTVLMLVAPALVGGSATPLATASAADPASAAGPAEAPAAPPQLPDDAPVSLDLVSLDPTSLAPDGAVNAQVEVTNTSSQPLDDTTLELRTRTSRVTERDLIAQWQSDATPDATGPVIAESSAADRLAPGESVTLSVRATAEELGYIDEPYYWGTRRISLTVVSGEEPVAAIRTFVVWRPDAAEDTITQSVLLPVASRDAAGAVTDPQEYAESIRTGRLAQLRELALREDVDWWLDPALMDPPSLPQDSGEEEASDSGEPAAGDEATPQPVVGYASDPAADEMATALDEGVGERTVLAMPYARTDLEALNAAGATELPRDVAAQSEVTWGQAEIQPQAMALSVPSEQADANSLQGLRDAGASAAIVPSSSLSADPASSITPSSIAVHQDADGGEPLPVLAPDPELSAEFSLLTGDSDTEQTRQRLLAETATIASEFTTAPRHLLISPEPGADLDAEAAGSTLDALAQAPWIETGRTGALLDVAAQESWVTDAQSESGQLYALGEVGDADVQPSGPGETGRFAHLEESEDPQWADPRVLSELEDSWGRLGTLESVMNDGAALDAPRLMVLSGASMRGREDPDLPPSRAEQASARAAELTGAIEVAPSSGFNLISDAAPVPITITNGLDTRITVQIRVSSDRPLVRVEEQPVVNVPARGQVETTVPVEAIANGTVTLTTTLTTEDGAPLTEPVEVPLTVNPAWENWTTVLVVIAMSLLMIVGVARARRTSASTRAPAVRGPEDPVELSRSGRSAPLTATDTDTDQHQDTEDPQDTENREEKR